METIQIEVKNKNALSILRSLEKAQMIKVISKDPRKKTNVHLKETISKKRTMDLSDETGSVGEEGIQKSLNTKKRTFGYAQDAITIQPDFDQK